MITRYQHPFYLRAYEGSQIFKDVLNIIKVGVIHIPGDVCSKWQALQKKMYIFWIPADDVIYSMPTLPDQTGWVEAV